MHTDKILAQLCALPPAEADILIKRYHAMDFVRRDEIIMELRGMERIDVPEGTSELPDGRPVFRVNSQAWSVSRAIHAARAAAGVSHSRPSEGSSETKSVVGTESLSQMTCPKCGDALQHTVVCPKCDAGKLGYRHRYSCVCGGVDLISKEAL